MDETKVGEKFLPNPLDTPEILNAQLEKPLLSTEEFIKTTPHHELKNMFGSIPYQVPEPKSPPLPPMPPTPAPPEIKVTPIVEPPKIFEPLVETPAPKEATTPTPKTESLEKAKPKLSIGKIFLGLFLILLVLLIGLYIWGGILKDRGVSVTTETSPQ